MDKLIDAALGIQPRALTVAAKRLELLAANMANADTPGFKARDIDFRAALQGALDEANGGAGTLETTHSAHLQPAGPAPAETPKYRIPNHPSLDGNTVDTQLEQAAFAEVAVRYQASLDFIDGNVTELRRALRGE
jgi:flagellar basal-body rod protein FlgB